MNTRVNLLDHFDLVTEADNGVERLRELILQLAVQGKLVPQDPNDEPASLLLERIAEEKARLVKEGKIRKSKPLQPITEEETPFDLPEGWKWVRLGDVGDWGAGATPSRGNSEYYSDDGIPWLKTGELNDGYIIESEEHITKKALKECSLRLNKPGDVLIAMYGATIGKLGILEIEATTNQACCACTPYSGLDRRYLFLYLLSIRPQLRGMGAGGAQPNISKQKIVAHPFPLPPLVVQKRIVERINSLLLDCAELKRKSDTASDVRIRTNRSALHSLTESTSTESLQIAWNRISDHFDELYSVPENVTKLKQAILQLAVQGRLVPQDPNDEPASVLLERIAVEKARLVKEGKIRKSKPLPPITEEEKPFELPEGWEWVKLGEIGVTQTGTTPPKKDDSLYGDVYPFIKPGDIRNGTVNEVGEKLSEAGFEVGRSVPPASVLMVCIGGSIGKVAVSEQLSSCNQQINYITPFPGVSSGFLSFSMRSQYFQTLVRSRSGKSTLPILNKGKWSALPVPVPPCGEQLRIEARINALLDDCDELNRKRNEQRKNVQLLATALTQVE